MRRGPIDRAPGGGATLWRQGKHIASSSPSNVMNIAEGYTKSTRKEFYQGIKMACNAVTELEYFVDLTLRLGYITVGMHGKLSNEIDATMRSLYGLLESLQDRKQEAPAPRPMRLAEAAGHYALIAFSQELGPGRSPCCLMLLNSTMVKRLMIYD